ncbi:MAG: universal stress protein [Methanomicrobiales archaeon]|nr:universal stress protein [Methanomicrobiales archaeon]MDD1670455.1 universal stress protein [Methanomicrobiales archaeon]
MFQSILAAIDGSKKSEAALDIAIGEAKLHGAALHVVYVIETGLFSSIPMDNTWEVIYGLLENQGKEAHLAAAKKAEAQGIGITSHLKEGHAGTEILKLARDQGVDLIVLGSHGKSNLDRILMGSVSSFVVSHSSVSTMVVRS